MSDDGRSEKLKERFGSIDPGADETSQADGASNTPQAGEASNTSPTDEAGEASDTQETPVRDRPTKLLYLEEDFKKELNRAFKRVNLMYEEEYDEDLEQNRHWYPLLLQLGYEAIGDPQDLDIEKFHELLQEVD